MLDFETLPVVGRNCKTARSSAIKDSSNVIGNISSDSQFYWTRRLRNIIEASVVGPIVEMFNGLLTLLLRKNCAILNLYHFSAFEFIRRRSSCPKGEERGLFIHEYPIFAASGRCLHLQSVP